MELRFEKLSLATIDALRAEAIVLPFFEDERPLKGAAGLCDWRMCGVLSSWIASGKLVATPGVSTLAPSGGRLPFEKLVLVGLGRRAEFSKERFRLAASGLIDALVRLRLRSAVASLPGRATGDVTAADAVRGLLSIEGADDALDELIVLDDAEVRRTIQTVLESERRRLRAARELATV